MSRLHIKYRPRTLSEFAGNTETKKILGKDLASEDPPRTLLFVGPKGCGKTTLAKITARMIGCARGDFNTIDIGTEGGIGMVREIKEHAGLMPEGKAKLYLLDEAHRLSTKAADGLLGTLEETPKHVFFALATTEPKKLPSTLRSRCSIYPVETLRRDIMEKLLNHVYSQETGAALSESKISAEVVQYLIISTKGCPRNALVLLSQVMGLETQDEMMRFIKARSVVMTEEVRNFASILLSQNSTQVKWNQIRGNIAAARSMEAESVRRGILGYLGKVLAGTENQARCNYLLKIMGPLMTPVYDSGWAGLVGFLYTACMQ